MERCLIVFAKEPEAGRVKTRLAKDLNDGEIIDIYKEFIRETLKIAKEINCEHKMLAYDFMNTDEFMRSIKGDFQLLKQAGLGLGERLFNAFKCSQEAGHQATVIMGSDSPDLPAKYLEKAFEELERSDVVLGPAKDGGYYLVGLKEPHEWMFEGIEWSRDDVLDKTIEKISKRKLVFSLLEEWYDIDTKEDLERYYRNRSSE